jgi:predicted PurR-regulated permease PerM
MAVSDHSSAPPDPAEGGFTRTVVFQGALLLGGLVAFFFLLIELHEVMNPLLLAAAAAVLVWPMREHSVAHSILLAGGLVLLWWLLMVTGEVLLPFAVVYLLAYLLDPAVSAAHRRWNVPRWASSLALTLVAVGALVAVLVFLVPNVVVRVEELVAGLLASLSNAQTWIMESRLVAYLDESNLIAREDLEARLTSVLPEQIGGLIAQIPDALEALTRSVSAIITLIVTVTLIPVLLFYILRDFPTIERNLIGLFPKVDGDRRYLQEVGHIVGSYLRGQIAISSIAAFNVFVFLTIFGAPFPLLIGLLAGALNLIPNVGVIITNVIGVGIALIFGTPVDALVVVLVLFGQQILEATILSPNIMSHQVGLHPVLVILSLLLFGATMGFFGLLIAVPLTALLVTFYKSYREEMTLDLSDYASGGGGLIVGPEAEVEAKTEEKAVP